MRYIKGLIEQMDEELEGAKDYAERYVYQKSLGNMQSESVRNATRYKEMAQEELKHAMYIHDMVVSEVARLEPEYRPTEAMREAWEHSHNEYVEETAKIKTMLTM